MPSLTRGWITCTVCNQVAPANRGGTVSPRCAACRAAGRRHPQRSCTKCGDAFWPTRRDTVRCSTCNEARRAGAVASTCAGCGGEIPVKPGRTPKLCKICLAKPLTSCSLCGEMSAPHGARLNPYCVDCCRARATDVRRDGKLRNQYGLSLATYLELLKRQQNSCGCCGRGIKARWATINASERACVDHCHDTGVIRGLLCTNCNTGIGLLGDNLNGVKKALTYLKGVDESYVRGKLG